MAEVKEFTTGEDDKYRRWLDNHPEGYLLNVSDTKTPRCIALHRADCKLMRNQKNNRVGIGFRKYCGLDIEDMKEKLRSQGINHGKIKTSHSKCLKENKR